MKLNLNVAKTEFVLTGLCQRLALCNDHEINVIVDNDLILIETVEKFKSLGLTIDVDYTWKKHIDKIFKKLRLELEL